jgi:dephospho-CoA kinase
MNHVIAFCGNQGSGKDFAATYLKSLGFKHLAFADKLRELTKEKYGFKDEHFLHPTKDEYVLNNLTPRQAMKLIAQEKRKDDDDYFVKDVMNGIKDEPLVVISDLRFPNEVKMLQTLKSVTIIKLERDRSVNDGYADKITSDYTINNNGHYYQTYKEISKILYKKNILSHKPTFLKTYENIYMGNYGLAIYLLSIGNFSNSALDYLINTYNKIIRYIDLNKQLGECLEKEKKQRTKV